MSAPHAGSATEDSTTPKRARVTPGEWIAFICGGVAGWALAELLRLVSGAPWLDHFGGLIPVAGGVLAVAIFTAAKSRNVHNNR
jgi:hypothetical protein